jgi:hypothetical protein
MSKSRRTAFQSICLGSAKHGKLDTHDERIGSNGKFANRSIRQWLKLDTKARVTQYHLDHADDMEHNYWDLEAEREEYEFMLEMEAHLDETYAREYREYEQYLADLDDPEKDWADSWTNYDLYETA